MNNLVINELERYKGELVAHCNKVLDMVAEVRRNEDEYDKELNKYLNDLLSHASMTQSEIVQINRKIEHLKRKTLRTF